jgi:hypothetical protein
MFTLTLNRRLAFWDGWNDAAAKTEVVATGTLVPLTMKI